VKDPGPIGLPVDRRPLLILDCYVDDRGCPDIFLPPDGTASARLRAAHLDPQRLPTDARAFRGLVLTGSAAHLAERAPWMLALAELVRSAARHRVPTLGVCFGHQLIAYALCGPRAVRPMRRPEFGWHDVELLRHGGFLARAEPRDFRCFLSHADEVVLGAPGSADLLVHARSAACGVAALSVRGRPMYGLQFHSELPLAEARELSLERSSQHAGDWSSVARGHMLHRAVDRSDLWRRLFGAFVASTQPPVPVRERRAA
jgi:GMP synthase (glutamine-hydrolysing)